MKRFALAAVLASFTLTAAAGNAAADGEAARFSYTGYMGGIKIGWAEADIALAGQRYAADLKMETGGLVGFFFEWRHRSASVGQAEASGDAPLSGERYSNYGFWKEKERYIEVAYRDGTPEIAKASPHPVKDENRPAVPADVRKGALDPLGAIVAIGELIERTGSCAADFGVYDGRRQYRLKVTDEGMTDIGRSRYAPFGGEVRKCAFVFERVAGFKKLKSDEPTAGRAYFRRSMDGAPLMPVQIAADTKYGGAILHLKEVKLLDPKLAERPLPDMDPAKLR